jgi:hypothetical protein
VIPVTDLLLRRYLAGALDPPDEALVAEALRGDAALQARLAGLLVAEIPAEAPTWRLPPPGARTPRPLAAGVRAGALMDDDRAPAAGDFVELRLEVPPEALDHRVVVLARQEGWEVIAPGSPEEVLTGADLPAEADGRRRLDLLLEGPGPWRFAAVLLPPGEVIAWQRPGPERWVEIQRALAEGRLAATTVSFP